MTNPTKEKITDIVTEGLNSVFDDLGKVDISDEQFVEYVTEAAREYAQICIDESVEELAQLR